MNEELRIIIRAVTDEAQRNLAGVREELDNINNEGRAAGKSIDTSMKSVAKGVAIAVGAVTALTTAMVALGKSSLEFQKQQAKLIAGFQAAGSTAQQANKTYKDLFRFMGDSDAATEAAQSLARITTSTEDLSEWTTILQGVYARAGNAIPVESLAEAANETIKVGVVTGSVADALNWLGVSEDEFNAKLAQTNSLQEREILLRSTLNSLYGGAASIYERNNQALIRYQESQAKVDIALAQAAQYIVPLMTELNELAVALLTVLKPAFETVSAVIIVFVQWIVAAIQYIGSFFGLFGEEGVEATKAVSSNIAQIQQSTSGLTSGAQDYGNALGDAAKEAEKLKKQVMGFDELNIVNSQTSASTGGGATGGGSAGGIGGGGITIPDIGSMDLKAPGLDDFQEKVDKIKERMKGILVLAGLVAGAFVAWKLSKFLLDLKSAISNLEKVTVVGGKAGKTIATFWQKNEKAIKSMLDRAKQVGGSMLIVAGAVALVAGYSDAWANGIDWGNFATILGGIAAIVAGLGLTLGPLAAAIGTIVGGIALVVLGIKDFIENGYSMQSVIMIAVGAILVLVGAVWAFNAALLANPITWIVAAILALVAVFVILWNECDGFRNFWIGLWEKVKVIFSAFVESVKPLIDAMVGAFKAAWEVIKIVWNDYLVPLFKAAWEAIKVIWDTVKPYFENIWAGIKLVFSVVKDILVGYFKVAWEGIKFVWSVVVSYFTMIWNNIKAIFSVVKSVLTGDFKGAWEGIKQIFSNVGSFFSGVVNKIKNLFSNVASTVGDTISKVVKTAINGVLNSAVRMINGFIGAINGAINVINAIPGVNIKTLNKLEVPKLARGGIVDSATLAMIGERGKEAVLPLENNTGWMDALADRIAARNNTPSRIVLMVDKKELGYATIGSINDITRQTGTLQLVY